MRIAKLLSIVAVMFVLASCSMFKHRDDVDTMPMEALYNNAHTSLENGDYAAAAKAYQRLIARFPSGEYNEQSQIELAYAQYKDNKPDDASSTINRFIKTFPTHKHIDYAYYLRGLINFDRSGNFLDTLLHRTQVASRRDQGYRLQSFDDFSELTRRFPSSPYSVDARQRMIYLRNGLAQFEINVAKFYLRTNAYIAAADRAQYVVEHYQQAPQVADALAIMTRSYKALGRGPLAAQTLAVLKLNYPDHPYLTDPDWPHHPSVWHRMIPFTPAY
ncbi:MAG TPA: outer membrane protein assembly factor BamD [Rhodanobacteraceae bacterium]|jgi:outer membrane protein assembly factor BamD|nr:outer membrane protein assembly factor BamD [Rhodanobacteraceae bacterium]